MDMRYRWYRKVSYWLLIGIVVLQSTALGVMIYFERQTVQRDQLIEQRTAVMIDDLFPEILQDLSTVSRKASEINRGVQDLKVRVAAVDEHVGDVGRNVTQVGQQVEGVGKDVNGFIQDRAGLIWGHSLNPYVLIGFLILIVGIIPISGWLFGRARREPIQQPALEVTVEPLEPVSERLDKLHTLLEQIRMTDRPTGIPEPELSRLIEETELLIAATREELAIISRNWAIDIEESGRKPENLH